ncbi:hypothetical protein [Brevundimonas sp.]|uniref:hypothetical protein n=1 Tax=Brevundimonas sp. TaxID=1871086 RepID=UPI0035B3C4E4
MTRFNATVQGGFTNRAGEFVHWVLPDRAKQPVQVKYWTPLEEGKRVVLEAGQIVGVQ